MQYSFYLYLPLVFLMLFFSVFTVNKIIKQKITDVKYPEIDGVRGYLAFFVFLHHGYIWSVFLKTKEWNEPNSNLFNQFGQTSVVFFFIITAFLFTNKLINSKNKPIKWPDYIQSRFFRLFPAYFISICLVFLIVVISSDFEIKETIFIISKDSL